MSLFYASPFVTSIAYFPLRLKESLLAGLQRHQRAQPFQFHVIGIGVAPRFEIRFIGVEGDWVMRENLTVMPPRQPFA